MRLAWEGGGVEAHPHQLPHRDEWMRERVCQCCATYIFQASLCNIRRTTIRISYHRLPRRSTGDVDQKTVIVDKSIESRISRHPKHIFRFEAIHNSVHLMPFHIRPSAGCLGWGSLARLECLPWAKRGTDSGYRPPMGGPGRDRRDGGDSVRNPQPCERSWRRHRRNLS